MSDHPDDDRVYAEKQEQIKRMEATGAIDPDCDYCRHEFYARDNPVHVFAPRHTASSRCESGRRSHCTCDTCF